MAADGITNRTTSLCFTKFQNVIDGKLVGTEKTRCSVNPSTLKDLPPVPVSTPADVDRAVEVAKKAQESWAEVPWTERRKAIHAFAAALESQIDDFSQMLTKEQGKPLGFANFEMQITLNCLRELANFPETEETIEETDDKKVIARYIPLGVVVGIVPWNFPIQLASVKLASALITGNTFILKSSPFTPYCSLKMAELAIPFFPPGVFQCLSGDDDLGPWLTAHPGVNKVTFTGSIATGKRVMESCSKTLKRVTLELGGNDPAIVCSDVDVVEVAPEIAGLALINSGQVCCAIKRVFVHESIYEALLKAMVEYAKGLNVGDGFQEGVWLGPVNNRLQYDRVKNLLEDIERTRLTVALGSTKVSTMGNGYFITPTIIDNPPDNSRIVVEEPFGPVFPVLKWSDEAEVIKRANDSDMGLGASVWTKDLVQAERIARKLQVGSVWINNHMAGQANAPFGGHKQSGVGVEYGEAGLKGYCDVQTLFLKK
ncbi:aldehyde dehydrogenase [Pseudomassariella vexata]|uniref:aldehyde dehydrogenase (NAD(+)) n=1 Tax=Pseudomassariella vexata TaxID=1141098 RepID=A0A1Y2EHI5_9PEZI|nr:aldehyde dehydrogenase [Pseudomassariella vexata]ORY70245.1 aldehyde dehydrogenase [Pseudomassariella vexata]